MRGTGQVRVVSNYECTQVHQRILRVAGSISELTQRLDGRIVVQHHQAKMHPRL